MDAFGLGFLTLLLSAAVAGFAWLFWKIDLPDRASKWPKVEATIQSGELEVLAHGRYGTIELPSFAFSYVVAGEYYSGRFALVPNMQNADSLLRKLINSKIQIHYDPAHPATSFVPGYTIEGCEIKQKLGSISHIFPRD